ncbi:MAG: hypothetical protein IJH32_07805 [Ruminococcus sp.]|nr:hypothetical protein [Ruminococcus sp.]
MDNIENSANTSAADEKDTPSVQSADTPDEKAEEKQAPVKKRFIKYLKIIGIIATILVALIAVPNFGINWFSCSKSVSDLSLMLISKDNRYGISKETLRIGANNFSDDDKFLTKGVIHITQLRYDNTPNINSSAVLTENGVNITICNLGWNDLKNVTIEADPDEPSYQNLKNPEDFSMKLDTMQYGQPYILKELTAEDLKDPTETSVIPLLCKAEEDGSEYHIKCGFYYDSKTGKFSKTGGKGGDIPTTDIEYCVQCENGTGEFEFPVKYLCPAHKYEEINFSVTADRSCDISYYIEFYAMDKFILRTEESGTHFTIYSYNLFS